MRRHSASPGVTGYTLSAIFNSASGVACLSQRIAASRGLILIRHGEKSMPAVAVETAIAVGLPTPTSTN
jgi:hypothetical protein